MFKQTQAADELALEMEASESGISKTAALEHKKAAQDCLTKSAELLSADESKFIIKLIKATK